MKAILEMDMPDACCTCPCYNRNMKCNAAGQRDVPNRMDRPKWCPLIVAEARCYLGNPCRYQMPV